MSSTPPPANPPERGDPPPHLRGALPLLLLVGALLALAVLLSRVAAGQQAPMLTYLTLAMGGSGLVLVLTGGGIRRGGADPATVLRYSVVAGALIALGSALGYLTVHRVGAAFIALALAFPPLLTWLLSFLLRMERFDALRVGGLLVALAGGALLAVGKGLAAPADRGAVLVACAMPIVLAAGNVFRSRYWPKGAGSRELAGAMLLCGALATLPFALQVEGAGAIARMGYTPLLLVTLVAIATFVAQYTASFRLQQIAGPVYMSQIGPVAAIVGAPVAVLAFGEALPRGFALAAALIIAGLAMFHYRATKPC
ncbi:hypothetical protein LDO26_09050 [Luteimonas sp. BDR2-5]|uniref:hypothetical protein n=1 Tax=Proluteimonas luteida TaxID=2878685 RepID=UPI001E53ADA8|nr:hypothetical protein [Luteimonas sp. BDR2-5]MCD9028355.1 hypothetical protein [Luteimonas sp. BDR2-5]